MKYFSFSIAALLAAVFLTGSLFTTTAFAKASVGKASIYWQGRVTANGEAYNKLGMTAAHRTLPFGTLVRVTHLRNGKQVVVRINDRGPFIRGRIIDLSLGAGRRIGLTKRIGVSRVRLEVIGRSKTKRRRKRR